MPDRRDRGFFDNFAERSSRAVSHAWFFALCVLMVVVWAPSYFLFQKIDTWQLVINTATTIVTFLLVALLQNSTQRFEDAAHLKLDALARALATTVDEDVAAELFDVMGIEEQLGA